MFAEDSDLEWYDADDATNATNAKPVPQRDLRSPVGRPSKTALANRVAAERINKAKADAELAEHGAERTLQLAKAQAKATEISWMKPPLRRIRNTNPPLSASASGEQNPPQFCPA